MRLRLWNLDRLKPVAQGFCRSAQGWVADLTGIPRFEGSLQSNQS